MRFWFAAAVLAVMPACAAQNEPFAAQVLRVAGMAPGSGAATDPDDEIDTGELWLVDLKLNTRRPIASQGFRSPVFAPSGDAVYAIRDDVIVRISLSGGAPEDVFQLDSITKLAGFAPDGRLLLTADDNNMVGFLTLADKKIRWLTPDESRAEDKAALERVRGWERVYGDTRVATERQTSTSKRWTDVMLHEGANDPVNVSQGDGVFCGQPAYAPAARMVVYVRAPQ
ncbi:MAG: hypothetical protein ACM336_19845 [Acidobacteriota bacterium]